MRMAREIEPCLFLEADSIAVVGLALLVKLFGPGLHRDFNAVGTEIHEIFRVRSSPDPRHIRRTIGQPRRGSREVRLSFSRSRSTRIGIVYPLCTGWNVHCDQKESQSKTMKYSHSPSLEAPSH